MWYDLFDWYIYVVFIDELFAIWVWVEIVMVMIDVICVDEMLWFSICVDDGCEGVVLDLLCNCLRWYCSMVCGNWNVVVVYWVCWLGWLGW